MALFLDGGMELMVNLDMANGYLEKFPLKPAVLEMGGLLLQSLQDMNTLVPSLITEQIPVGVIIQKVNSVMG